MFTFELLRGKTIRLSALKEEDSPLVAEWYAEGNFMRLYSAATAFPKTERDILEMIEEGRDDEEWLMFGLRRLRDGLLVGIGGFDEISWRNRVGWLALAVGRNHWEQGYGSEALRLLLRYGFMELDLHKVQLTVLAYNERALGIYRKAGFRQEGVFREFVYRDGERHDMILMGMLADEWQSPRATG
ncbi:MAG: GNAT family protein [Chloroflexota bacterium]|nr:GNAT family protein [Chloroflexota bacterium]